MTFAWLRPGLMVAILLMVTACGGRNASSEAASSTSDFEDPTVPVASSPSQVNNLADPKQTKPDPDAPVAAQDNITTAPVDPPQPAVLTAADAQAQINLRSEPSTDAASKGYGLVGDPVRLLKTAADGGDVPWYYVKFDGSGAEGWIRGDFIDASGKTAANLQVDTYTIDDLFTVSEAGCGMVLSRPSDRDGSYVFANSLEPNDTWMRINGTMTRFRRTSASGEPFYGQTTFQQFTSVDGSFQVELTVTPGAQDYEVIEITGGTLTIRQGETQQSFTVVGDAGC
ncbi:MAG: SH3 domain-containing protein [Cyanobacteria bacterium]|nr:SH3 domain-containing protein [Cyanobacteriota bacterium]MDA0865825.1 SH3 domain-containing protein [Cyanobacteriota bacterium]